MPLAAVSTKVGQGMKFLLTGGGDFEHFRKVDQKFQELLNSGDRIQVLPYASGVDEFDEIFERIEDTYGRGKKGLTFGLEKNINKLTQDDLLNARALFIEGGNTFDLITLIRNANTATYLKAFEKESDKIIYADSAGAIILGNSVRTAFFGEDADEDAKRLQDYRGLDLLNSWVVHAHYTVADDDAVMSFVYDEGLPVLAFHEKTGVYISDDSRVEVLTSSPLVIFTAAGKQVVSFNEDVQLSDFY